MADFLHSVANGLSSISPTMVLVIAFAICSVFATAQLLTMWGTRWGDHHVLMKSFVLSLIVHLCLGLGWASTVSPLGVPDASVAGPVPDVPEPVTLIDDNAPPPANASASLLTAMTPVAPDLQPSRQDHEEVTRAELTPSNESELPIQRLDPERPAEAMPLPETARSDVPEVAALDPVIEAPMLDLGRAAPPVDDVMDADAPAVKIEARSEQPAAERARRVLTADARETPGDALPRPPSTVIVARSEYAGAPSSVAAAARVAGQPRAPGSTPGLSAVPEAMPRGVPGGKRPPQPTRAAVQPAATPEPEKILAGVLRGLVRDRTTGRPLTSATVRIDQIKGHPLIATTNDRGIYELTLVDLPDNFAISASRPGYLPTSQNLRSKDVDNKVRRIDFALEAIDLATVAVERDPHVHHLGNDRFRGEINSQFQHKTEGAELTLKFNVLAEQLAGSSQSVTLTFLVKGAQCPPTISINDHAVETPLKPSPEDGSFGRVNIPVDGSWLREGENRIAVTASNCRGDLDDFEFVNVQLKLQFTP